MSEDRIGAGASQPLADPFLHALYDSRGDSPLQRRLRQTRPLPVGVVLIQQFDMSETEMRRELQTIREAGFGNLKQFHFMGQSPMAPADAELLALGEGINPYWYGIGGWQPITPSLCRSLGISDDLTPAEIQANPAMIAYQTQVLSNRAVRRTLKGMPPETAGGMGEPSRLPCAVPPKLAKDFEVWLQRTYETLAACRQAYKIADSDPGGASWEAVAAPFVTESDVSSAASGWADFRRVRDVLRFQADRHFTGIHATAAWHHEWDPDEPVRSGCHLIFENQAISGWDFELQAQAIKTFGSFYASFHPAHHLTEVGGELDIPCYLTARLVADFSKGGWPAMWESVGGPSEYSGTHSLGIDGSQLTRILLSYLAAGLKGIGLWSWNVRDWGWEIGEYALTDLNGRQTSRSIAAGAVARACEKWRWELWEARDEPLVGILYSWENEAAFARLGQGSYPVDRIKTYPVRPSEARIGVARALIGGNMPFEFVTERDLAAGLAHRYRTIYVPHTICLGRATLATLRAYAETGGHVIIDAPTLLICADDGLLFRTGAGSDFERLFGFEHADLQNSFSRETRLKGVPITDQTFDVTLTTAAVEETFDGTTRPAVIRNSVGLGRATALTFEASRLCHKPGNDAVERLIRSAVTSNGGTTAPWTTHSDSLITYRRVAPDADHYFVINTTPASQTASLVAMDREESAYGSGEDCLTDEKIDVSAGGADFTVPAGSARWIRLSKRSAGRRMTEVPE